MPDFKTQICTKSDLEKLTGFLKKNKKESFYCASSTETKYILARYEKQENKRLLNIILLLQGRDIIGFSGFFPFKSQFCATKMDGCFLPDIFIDPAYRNKFPALFTKLYLSHRMIFKKNTRLLLTFPHDKKIEETFHRIGWNKFTALYTLCFHSQPYRYDPMISDASIRLKNICCFNQDVDDFYKRISTQYDFIMLADKNYLNFRYASGRRSDFMILTAYRRNMMLGYIVARTCDAKGYIVEIVADLEYPKIILFLISATLTTLKKRAKKFYCSLSHRKYLEILLGFGFNPLRKKHCLFLDISSRTALFDGNRCHINRTGRTNCY